MSKPERVAEERAVREAMILGVRSIKLTPRGQRGHADRLFWVPGGRPLLVEFKREGEKPRVLQAHRHDTLRKAGYEVMVATDWRPVAERIRAMLADEDARRRMLALAADDFEEDVA